MILLYAWGAMIYKPWSNSGSTEAILESEELW